MNKTEIINKKFYFILHMISLVFSINYSSQKIIDINILSEMPDINKKILPSTIKLNCFKQMMKIFRKNGFIDLWLLNLYANEIMHTPKYTRVYLDYKNKGVLKNGKRNRISKN
jgi:hypothetical protein